jgi:hypothetical protein
MNATFKYALNKLYNFTFPAGAENGTNFGPIFHAFQKNPYIWSGACVCNSCYKGYFCQDEDPTCKFGQLYVGSFIFVASHKLKNSIDIFSTDINTVSDRVGIRNSIAHNFAFDDTVSDSNGISNDKTITHAPRGTCARSGWMP